MVKYILRFLFLSILETWFLNFFVVFTFKLSKRTDQLQAREVHAPTKQNESSNFIIMVLVVVIIVEFIL